MSIFKKDIKKRPTAETDDIPEKIHRRLHIIYFFLKCIIAASVFLMFYNELCTLLLDIPDIGEEDSPFLRHEYCGTFYVEINKDNSFASQEAYDAYIAKESSQKPEPSALDYVKAAIVLGAGAAAVIMLIIKKFPRFLGKRGAVFAAVYAGMFLFAPEITQAGIYFCYALLFLALRSGDKKTIFCKKASDYFIVGGAVWFIVTVIHEIFVIKGTAAKGEGLIGVFSRPTYYFQAYDLFAIPLVVLCGGLMLRRRELEISGGKTQRNSSALKTLSFAAIIVTAGFVLWRLPVRVYELIKVISGADHTVKLPFTVMETPYNKFIELPPELADSPAVYRQAVGYRFIKDFPVFVLATLAVWFFVKVLFAVSRGELNTKQNRKRLNVSMILLVIASLWFNLMGFPELKIFNEGFTGVYGEVVYTMALRSKTEPALYAMVLWFFKTYLQTIPETQGKDE